MGGCRMVDFCRERAPQKKLAHVLFFLAKSSKNETHSKFASFIKVLHEPRCGMAAVVATACAAMLAGAFIAAVWMQGRAGSGGLLPRSMSGI